MNKLKSFPRGNIIVIHPTSIKLRIGRSNDSEPLTIPHCIARKIKKNAKIKRQPMLPDNRACTALNNKFNNAIKLTSIAMKSSSLASLQPFKEQPTINELLQMNKQNMKINTVNKTSENNEQFNDEIYVGEDALNLPQTSPYCISWPFWNDKVSDEYSRSAAIKDMEDIWRIILEKEFKIKSDEICNYSVILVIPDIIVRCEIRWLVEMLLNELHFSQIVLQQENVCVTYSTGLPSACVVNIHDNSVSVTCVEEGISIPEGRIKLAYGVGDLLSLFHFLLMRIGLPRNFIDSYSDYGATIGLSNLFTTACNLIPSIDSKVSKLFGLDSNISSKSHHKLEMFISTEAIIAGLALFHPSLICTPYSKYQLQQLLTEQSEPDDPFDDLYLTLTSRDRKKQRLEDTNQPPDDLDGDESCSAVTNIIPESPGSNPQNDTSKALSLTDAIVKSINRSLNSTSVTIDNQTETSQQLCSIIVVGEQLGVPGWVDWLQESLKMSLSQCGEVEVIHNDFSDGISASIAAWKGASMITLVGFCDDLWISSNEWRKYGSRTIREKAPFLW